MHVKTPMARPGGGGPAIGVFGLRVCAIVREEFSMSVLSALHGSTKVLASHSDISMISFGAVTVRVTHALQFSQFIVISPDDL